jgi:hypothetical protein
MATFVLPILNVLFINVQEKFGDAKGIIRSRKSKIPKE